MNILCDFHHSDLWWSSHLIFERALGHTLFRPRGMEWFEQGYYQTKYPQVAGQFLSTSMFKLEELVHFPMSRVAIPKDTDGLRASMNTIEGCPYYPLIKTLSFEEFTNTKIDAIMATTADTQEPWFQLRNRFKPYAKLIREEGNVLGYTAIHPEYKNVLTSDLPTFNKILVPNKVLYHQRFDTAAIFYYREPSVFNRVTSFMPQFRSCDDLVRFAERHDFGGMEFVDYGYFAKGGFLTPKEKFAEKMRETTFVWHVKPGGDGFGHVIHNSFAMGRPVITKEVDYKNSIAGPLLEDTKTCILIGSDPAENSKKIQALSNPEAVLEMSRRAKERFYEVVNYDEEAKQIGEFLGKLV